MILNDMSDVEIDKINHPERPLVNGEISIKTAVCISSAFIGFSEYLNLSLLSENLQGIVHLSIADILLYTPVFKKITLFKNLSCSGLVAFSVFFTGLAAETNSAIESNPHFPLFSLTINFILLGSLYNELLLDMRDIKGDKENQVFTIHVVFGEDVAFLTSAFIIYFSTVYNVLNMTYLYGIESGIILLTICSPLLYNNYQIKLHDYSENIITKSVKSTNIPLFSFILFVCYLAAR
jgi:geranylgeranylglycerol-phosphate geranylgeranyltransferase